MEFFGSGYSRSVNMGTTKPQRNQEIKSETCSGVTKGKVRESKTFIPVPKFEATAISGAEEL